MRISPVRILPAVAVVAALLGAAAPARAQVVVGAPSVEVDVDAPAPPPTPPAVVVPAPPVVAPPVVVPAPPVAVVPQPMVPAPPVVVPAPRAFPVPPPATIYINPGALPPHVYIRERVRWRMRRLPRVVVVGGMVRPVAVVPAPPLPPTVYVTPAPQPLPPIPPPVVVPPIYYAAPAVVLERPRPVVPMWKARIGLGVRGTGQVEHDGWNNLGIGGELLFRASPHLVTELAAEYQHSAASAIDRTDVPVTFGLRVHIGRPDWVVSPYFVFAGGLAFAQQDLRVVKDDAIFLDGQLGFGLEIRLGQHVALTADARADGRRRVNDPSPGVAATTSVDGKSVHPLGNTVGGQFRLGVAAYF